LEEARSAIPDRRNIIMAKQIPDLVAEARTGTGKGAARQARRQGKVPGIVYGDGKEPLPLQFDFNPLLTRLRARKSPTEVARIRAAIAASATTMTDIFGIGPIIAAMLIGYTGDIARFRDRDHYAAYNGTAPVEFSSGGRTVHRLSTRGNR